MARKCHRCHEEGHFRRDCPRNRLRAVPDPEPQASDPLGPGGQAPDLSAAYAYWDTMAPLVTIEEAWWGRPADSPAQVAREMRLRAEAARQVAESRAARGVL